MPMPFARPWRHPKTGTYWFRRRVPKELQPLLGRCEERKTLGTKEPALARTRYLQAAAEVDERWNVLRRALVALEGASQGTKSKVGLLDPAEGSLRRWPRPPIARATSPQVEDPAIPSALVAGPVANPVPWRGVFAAYASEAKLAPATIKRWTGVLTALEEVVGTDDLARVTREDLIAWKSELVASGRDSRTVRDAYIAAVKAVMNWAVANARLPANPAAGLVVVVPNKPMTRDREFTDAEATTILRASLELPDPRLSHTNARARRWVPWLCAYGGARVNEMTQLRGCDIRIESDVWVMRITPEAGRVKTGRWRDVPLHPHLLEQGFVDVAHRSGAGPIFYDPARQRNREAAHPIYKKVGERLAAWVRAIGVDDTGVDPNHGWRHRFKTVGRRAGINHAVLDAIQGHAPRTEGEHYGRYPADVMFEAVRRIPRYDVGLESGSSAPTMGCPSK